MRTADALLSFPRLFLLLGMVVFFSWASPFFLSVNNFLNIGSNISYIGIMAIAMTMVIVSGGFDLSVGAVVALTAVTVAKIHDMDVNIWIAVAAGFAVGPSQQQAHLGFERFARPDLAAVHDPTAHAVLDGAHHRRVAIEVLQVEQRAGDFVERAPPP